MSQRIERTAIPSARGEAEQAVLSTCSRVCGSMRAFVNSHCSSRARARSKPSLTPRPNARGGEACPQRELHVQERIEAASREALAELAVGSRTGVLVEDDELDVGHVTEQLVLQPADESR